MQLLNPFELFFILLVVLFIIIQVVIVRWIFRINTIVRLLQEISDLLKNQKSEYYSRQALDL